MTSDIQNCLANLLQVNEERYQMFSKRRLELCDVPIIDSTKCISLHLPSSLLEDTNKVSKQANMN